MRKSVILLAFILGGFIVANAQSVVEGIRPTDSWPAGVSVGGVTPLTHSAFFKGVRSTFEVGVPKQLAPILGLGFQGMGYISTTFSKTAFDASDVSVLGRVNLMSLFASYTGESRLFEAEAVVGMGWLHYYVNGDGDQNSWPTRLGLDFNFNLGESKTWTLGIKPAIVYDIQNTYPETKSRFDANGTGFELTAGLTYRLKISNGIHHFAKVKVYNQAEIGGLNSSINVLRADINNKDGRINNANQHISGSQEELEAYRAKVVPVETVVKTARIPGSIITFRQSKSSADTPQLPNVECAVPYLRKYVDSKVVIRGCTSSEGSVEVNVRIATTRTGAVEMILVNKYKISASRITAESQGVGDIFTEPDWDRVSTCTIGD